MAAVEFGSTSLRDDPNLVAYWKLEDLTADAGGFTLTNNNTVTFSAAKFNNGGDQGTGNTNKYLNVVNNLGITGGSATFNEWINVSTAPALNGQYRVWTQEDATNKVRFNLRYSDVSGTKRLGFFRTKLGVGDQSLTVDQDLSTGVFNMVTLTYDNSNIIGYINGTALGTAAASGTGSSAGASNFLIGMHEDGTSVPFSGIHDDFSVLSRGLTAGEVNGLFQGTLAPRSTNKLSTNTKYW